ncbi:hypothetical protein MXAN_3340 [Myxococcus xanthus DK 1622]|uniref:Uncharacterized protein n=1 Tax=Myxococcus xanthus (strain DK1622) TaxID=246197 RepID=Q1D733_MYXXD|nr:hypothetical protein MXAN_3340 [Myxococcus xanthus DK 1622]
MSIRWSSHIKPSEAYPARLKVWPPRRVGTNIGMSWLLNVSL